MRIGVFWTLLLLVVAFVPVAVIGQNQTKAGQTKGGQAKAAPAPATTPPPLAIRPPTGTSHDDWIKSWQSRIPITATLFRGEHRGQVQGSFFQRNDVDYPVFTATVRIQNRSGYQLTTGSDLYLIQNGTERDGSRLLHVIGGDFREPPTQDYAGEVELRGAEVSPDMQIGLIDSIDSKSRRGFFGSAVDVLLSVGSDGGNILDRRSAEAKNFGSAAPGRDLSFETNDLQLTVHVQKQYEDGVYVISPPPLTRRFVVYYCSAVYTWTSAARDCSINMYIQHVHRPIQLLNAFEAPLGSVGSLLPANLSSRVFPRG